MTTVTRRDNESIEDALKRLKESFGRWACFVKLRSMNITKNPAKSRSVRRLRWHETKAGGRIINNV